MSFATRTFVRIADVVRRKPLSAMSLEEIQRRRASILPSWFPASLIFGRVPAEVAVTAGVAPTRAGTIGLRVYHPGGTGEAPLIVFFHGGGWVTGNVQSYDPLCAQIAHRVGAVVISLDYRLAPEHPFPAAVEDAHDATVWLIEHASSFGASAGRVAVMGDSAGGNLAAVTCLLARDLDGPPISAQALIYPGTDATLQSPSIAVNAQAPILTRQGIIEFLDLYHPTGDRRDPLLSPLHAASHAGLPPALIQTAEFDPLLDDGFRYAEALRSAAVSVRYTRYDGVPHGFASFPGVTPIGETFHRELAAFLRTHLLDERPAESARPHG